MAKREFKLHANKYLPEGTLAMVDPKTGKVLSVVMNVGMLKQKKSAKGYHG